MFCLREELIFKLERVADYRWEQFFREIQVKGPTEAEFIVELPHKAAS